MNWTTEETWFGYWHGQETFLRSILSDCAVHPTRYSITTVGLLPVRTACIARLVATLRMSKATTWRAKKQIHIIVYTILACAIEEVMWRHYSDFYELAAEGTKAGS